MPSATITAKMNEAGIVRDICRLNGFQYTENVEDDKEVVIFRFDICDSDLIKLANIIPVSVYANSAKFE